MESMNEEKELLEHVMKLMAEHFGKNCEIVLHDFMAPDNHTIIGIENGEVTGREIGGCVTNLGLEILNGKPAEDAFNYATYAVFLHLFSQQRWTAHRFPVHQHGYYGYHVF